MFALTSVSEAASLTLLEAMASAVPVVVTAVGGNPELVRDGIDGLHVPRANAHATARPSSRSWETRPPAAAMGSAGRQRVVNHYQLEATVQAYLAMYQKVLRRTPQHS